VVAGRNTFRKQAKKALGREEAAIGLSIQRPVRGERVDSGGKY